MPYAALALAAVTLGEATIGIFVKLVGSDVPIFTLNFYRVFFAAVFLLVAVGITAPRELRFPSQNIRDIAIIGVLIALQISCFNIAMTLAPVANVVVFWSVAPFFVFIFSSLFLRERPRPVYIPIFLVALLGVVLAKPVSFAGGAWSEEQLGNVIALATGAIYAAMVTYLRREGKTETQADIFWFMVAASLYLSPALFLFGPGALLSASGTLLFGVTVPVVVWVLGLGMFSTGAAFFGINYVLKRMDANIYSLIDIIVSPVVAAILAALVFAEIPSVSTVIGGAVLLLAGAALTLLRRGVPPRPDTQVAA